MQLTRCENKHFYDADKYSVCPHCDKNIQSAEPEKKEELENVTSQRKISIWNRNKENKIGKKSKESDIDSKSGDETALILPDEAEIKITPETEINLNDGKEKEDSEKSSLQSQVNEVTSHNLTEDVKTVAFYDLPGVEPVVGWLVCVKGEYIGQSFNLKTGRNNIGRAMNMDVPLAQEPSVSRNTHAVFIYEPQKKEFYIQAGDSSGLTYLNKELVMTFVPVNAYDNIKLGNCEFIFIPCCGEMFTWEDYI